MWSTIQAHPVAWRVLCKHRFDHSGTSGLGGQLRLDDDPVSGCTLISLAPPAAQPYLGILR
jgi:hypothetical protein